MKKTLFAALVMFLLFASVCFGEQTINVAGNGVVQIEPDTATVKLGVEVTRKTAEDAQKDNANIMRNVAAAISNLGVPKDKIQTAGFYIWPETKYEQNQPAKTVGYRCSNQLSIIVEDLAKVSKVIDSGIGAGANNVQGLQFLRKDDAEAKRVALDKAVKDAAEKARAIATAAGVKIKGIKSITESGAVTPLPLMDNAVRAMAVGGAETPVSPGLLEVRGSVTISYSFE